MFKTIRRYYWVSQSFIAKHFAVILRTTGIVLGIITLFYLFARYLPTPKQHLRIARVGKYTLADFPADLKGMVSQGLVKLDPDGGVKPGLAQTWDVSDDELTYTFKLNPELSWHNGRAVTATDINYNFQEVEVNRDNLTISFQLKEPFAPFFAAVSQPILQKDRFGVGDYRITKTVLGNGVLQYLRLENETTRLIYKFYPTESSALTAYKMGEVDYVEGLTLYPRSFETDKTSQIVADPSLNPRQSVLFFNNNDSLFRDSKPTRQALAYAIKDKTFGRTRAPSPIERSSWADNPLVKTYDYDLERAKSLFAQANPDPGNIKIEIKTMLSYLDVAESIAADWRNAFKIDVSVKVISSVSSDYQVLLVDFAPPVDPDQYTIWHSTQPTNFTHYSNLKVDQLLEDGRRTSNLKLRKEQYQDFQRFLLEDCPAIFLFESNTYTLSRKPLFNNQ